MRKAISILWCVVGLAVSPSVAQKIDEARMERDIEVAENILKTLIQQQFDKQRMFFGLEVDGTYQEGFGVTFRLPANFTTPVAFNVSGDVGDVVWMDGDAPNSFSYSYSFPRGFNSQNFQNMEEEMARFEKENAKIEEKVRVMEGQAKLMEEKAKAMEEKAKALEEKAQVDAERVRLRTNGKYKVVSMDSVRDAYNNKVIAASQQFLMDYGDLISQLKPEERIVITNRGEQPRAWMNYYFTSPKRTHLSLEVAKGDITAYRQGKLNREQALSKIKVVNTESVEAVDPDLELLSSIFNRLYRSDLSKTYFTSEGIYYERLKDYGAVYYMNVYSSNVINENGRYSMPTVNLSGIDQAERDKKVKELYPVFEKDLKENLIEYGRTIKSLQDNELLVLNVKLTRCNGCGIPATLELSVKANVLKEYSSGKINKDSALTKVTVKKGQSQ